MINVVVKSNKDKIESIFVSGHANYSEFGSDIVCAAVSTAMYMSANLLSKLNLEFKFKEDSKKTTMEIIALSDNEVLSTVLENLVATLESIESDYKDYIKIKQ